ncbi:hypothetical protein K457DRAFT_198745 [Linnemannia elongata AG-77]|uniref:Uncharacterized protein n=1 Tax=Linnemannia elongata AG-77 TaxID=1314771 RepID=A0A197JF01_9FUNG|nr:hypothetical protein K457DRAFT_198745 [Linnemannia elongata AG-77]
MSSPWGLCSLARFLSFYPPLFFSSFSFFLLTLFFFSLSLSLSPSLTLCLFILLFLLKRHFVYLFFILVFPFVHIRIHIPPGTNNTYPLSACIHITITLSLLSSFLSCTSLFFITTISFTHTRGIPWATSSFTLSPPLPFLLSSLLSLSLSLSLLTLTSLSPLNHTLTHLIFFFCNPRQFKKEHFHVCIVQLLLSITQHYIHIHTHTLFSISFPTPASASKLSHPCLSACLLLIVILFCMLTASLFNGCILVSLFVGTALDHNCLLALLGRQE